MEIYKNHTSKRLSAFHTKVKAKYVAVIDHDKDLLSLLSDPKYKNLQKCILGESSGTLFSENYDGLIIKVNIKGIEIIKETEKQAVVEIGAGEIWDNFVVWAIKNNFQGVENLSGIPGTVGAAPVQNIAAYGQNFEDIFVSLRAINLKTGKLKVLSKKDLKFAYRDSVFKNELKDKFLITNVALKLNKQNKLDLSYYSRYGSLTDELQKVTQKPYSLKDVRTAVVSIRSKKFPDWKKLGNTGSFFKNPIVSQKKLKQIQNKYPDVQYYPAKKVLYVNAKRSKNVKLAAGWLLEELGWKGKRIGKVGTSPNQALVIVNYGGATSQEILDFADKMNKDFQKHFGIKLEPEVNIV